MNNIGTNARTMIEGVAKAANPTIGPSVAAILYAGDVDESAIVTLETNDSASVLRPFVAAAF
jgi:hypothetical protein